jgi:hydrogenase expression/formation protein HypE
VTLGTGKLPADLLRSLVLGRLGQRRPETLIGASLGVDAAAVAIDADWACVLTTDPITTAVAGAGRLGVHVVCNDLAAMGADPIGILATLLFPAGTSPEDVERLCTEIDAAARDVEVEILGGHTEIAPGLHTALVVMTGVGRARRDRLLTAAGAQPGDALVLTKAAGLEGTHVLAADLRSRMVGRVPDHVLDEAAAFGDELSVVPDARVARDQGATAMHDPTEGGVVGATWEIAEASHCGFRIEAALIPVRAATRAVCSTLGVDPLRLIASGALLVACPDGPAMVEALGDAGIPAAVIGAMLPWPEGRTLVYPDRAEPITRLDRDELYRILELVSSRE